MARGSLGPMSFLRQPTNSLQALAESYHTVKNNEVYSTVHILWKITRSWQWDNLPPSPPSAANFMWRILRNCFASEEIICLSLWRAGKKWMGEQRARAPPPAFVCQTADQLQDRILSAYDGTPQFHVRFHVYTLIFTKCLASFLSFFMTPSTFLIARNPKMTAFKLKVSNPPKKRHVSMFLHLAYIRRNTIL